MEIGLFVVVLGIPDGALGVLWPSLRHTFHRPIGDLGILVLAGTALYFCGGLATGRTVRTWGTGGGLTLAAVLAGAGVTLWGLAPGWIWLVAAIAVFGFARGIVDAAVNAVASVAHGVRRLGLLHATYGAGATLGPLMTAALIGWAGTWRAVVAALWVLVAVLAARTWALRRSWPELAAGAEQSGEGPGMGRAVVTATLAVFTLYTAAEGSAAAWVYTVLREAHHLSSTHAAVATALFWVGLTGGRFGLAAGGHRLHPTAGLNAGAALAAAGMAALWVAPHGAELVALPLVGLGFAPAFPVLMALMPERVGEERAAMVIGWAIGAAAVGGPVAVALLGVLADHGGTSALAPGLFVVAVAYAVGLAALSVLASGRSTVRPRR